MSPEMIPTGIIRQETWVGSPNHMVACLIVSLQKAGHTAIILDKLQLVTQGLKPGTNSSQVNGSPTKIYKIRPHFSRGCHCP